jgi:hypothetical protein
MRNLLLLARLLGNRHNLEVVVDPKASVASVNRETLTLPATWVGAVLPEGTPHISELLEGVIDHLAAGHARHTDFDAYDSCSATAGPLKRSILSVLEDLRVERLAAEVYPGIARNLARTVELLAQQGFFGRLGDIGKALPAQTLVDAMLCVGRAALLPGQGEPLLDLARTYDSWARTQCPAAWLRIKDITRRAWAANSTSEVTQLVNEVMLLLSDLAAARSIPSDRAAVSSDGGGTDDSLDSGSADQNDDLAADGVDGQNKDTPDDDGAVPAPNVAAPTSTVAREQRFALSVLVQQDVRQSDIGDIAGEALQEAVSALPPQSLVPGQSSASAPAKPIPPSWITTAAAIRARLGRDLEALLESRRETNNHVGLVGRRLSMKRLHRLAVLDARVFRRRRDEDGINACATLLVDVSGSMTVKASDGFIPIDAAGGTLVALAEVLEAHEVPFAATVFNSRFCTIKRFDESWKRVAHTAAAIPQLGGKTALAPALRAVLFDMVAREEDRRLIIVVLDGRTPNMEQVGALYADALEMAVEIATVLIAKTGDAYVVPYAEMLKRLGRRPHLTHSMETLAKTIIDEIRSLI